MSKTDYALKINQLLDEALSKLSNDDFEYVLKRTKEIVDELIEQ